MKDPAVSVRARLTNYAKANNSAFQDVLQRYANERILHRLGESEHRESFVLKGAVLFVLWTGAPHRATKDLDLLGHGDLEPDRLREIFASLFETPVDPSDGLEFDLGRLDVSPIRSDKRYGGLRITTIAKLAGARIPIQIDVGFGDAAKPEWQQMESLLDQPRPRVRAYTRYEVVAEKVEAMIQLQTINSRMKDFFDVRYLGENFEFHGMRLSQALQETFLRRQTVLPHEGVSELFPRLLSRPEKPSQWAGFLRKALASCNWTFEESLAQVERLVGEPLKSAAINEPFNKSWRPGGPWREGEAE